MFSNAHDEYSGGNPNKVNKPNETKNKTKTKNTKKRQSKANKRPQRPKRTAAKTLKIEKITVETIENKATNDANQETDPSEPPANAHYKFRGRGSSKEKEKKKPNPWAHAHDEYAAPKRRAKSKENPIKRAKSPKRRPVRIRFETDDANNLYNDGDNHPEEKSNRPFPRPFVTAANIHGQNFGRSGYRKQLPPDPHLNRRTNQQKMAHGQANFETMIKQAAAMEGLDKSDVKVQRMIRRLGDQMNEVSGFGRFLQNRDNELAKMVAKQNKRKKQLKKIKKNINNYDHSGNSKPGDREAALSDPTPQLVNQGASPRVKDLAAQFERRNRSATSRRQRNQARRQLNLPNTRSHRRRVSSQYSVQAIGAILSASSKHSNSPFIDAADRDLTFPNTSNNLTVNMDNVDTRSDSAHDTNTLAISNSIRGRGRTASYGSRASISHHSRLSAVPSIIIKSQNSEHSINTLIIASPNGDDDDIASHATPSVDGTFAGDPLYKIFKLLKKEPVDRSTDDIDYLVAFFDQYQIMTQDVDSWSGQLTFREFIKQTRYRYIPSSKHVFREGDDGDVFYFVLRGNVAVLVDDSTMVHTTHGSKRNLLSPKKEIHTVLENHVFGEIAMFNQGKRSATCVAKTDTHLAYWDRATYDEFIRPMKELKAKAQKILRDKSGNMLSEDQLIEKAAMFLDDAMHGRELKMHRNGPWPRRIHKLINHKYFNYCLIMVSMLWLALIFIEPPSWRDSIIDTRSKYFYRIMPLIAFEWFVFFVFAGECLLRFYSFGRAWFLKSDLHVVRVVCLLVFFVDLVVACLYSGNSFRFSRVVRPIFPILFIRDLRRQYYIVLACVPYVIELIILWGIVAAIFARIAYHIFYHCVGHLADGHTRVSVFMQAEFEQGASPYDDAMAAYCAAAVDDDSMTRCDHFFGEFVWNSFSTFFKSVIALFGLATTETYPDVWWPTWVYNDGHQYWIFFVVYIMISVFFLLNLFSAAVYDAYQHIISRLDVIDEKRETQALKVAWICLDTGDSGSIGPQKFENLMYRLKPEYTTFEIDVIFKLLDPDNTRLIDAEEFSVMMINMLFISITRKTRSKDDELKLYLQRLGGSCPYGYEILRAFTSQTWRYILLIVDCVDICVLLSYHMFEEECNVIDFICIVFILFALIVEIIFKHRSQIVMYFKSNRNRLYFGLTVLQTIGTMVGIVNDREWVSALRFFGIFRLLIVGVFVLEKVKYLRTSLTRTLTQTVIFMIPVFLRIVFYTVIVLLYIYTIIGMEVFVDPDELTWGKNRCSAPQQLLSNPYALFCDANMSVITLIQILTTNNWHIIMYTALQVTDNWLNSVYFITFFFLGPILVVSLLLAMFFNMFFGISVQSENELSAFFQATDAEAESLKKHMELQQFREQMQNADDEFMRDVPLPTEVGISELPTGAKILTIRRAKNKLETDDHEQQAADTNGEIDPNGGPQGPQLSVETELVHIPLLNVARQIWDNIPGQDWTDERSNNTYKQTFTGREATNYLLDAGFAPDGEEAVDYLALIMDDICAFMRVDAGKEQEFENDDNAHYQWIIVPDEEDGAYDGLAEEYDEDDQVALEDIMIGFRHSYGGYHRLLKQYRAAGIDPAQQAARDIAAKHAVCNTPLSELSQMNTPGQSPVDNSNTSPMSAGNGATAGGTDLALGQKIVAVAKHVHSKSQKTLDGIATKLRKEEKEKESKEEKLSPLSINISNFSHLNDDMAESDDEGVVVSNIERNKLKNTVKPPRLATIDSTTAIIHGLGDVKTVFSGSNTNFGNIHNFKATSVELSNTNTNKAKKATTPSTKMRKTQSNETDFKRTGTKTLPQSENEDSSQTQTTTAPLSRLQKSKSVKNNIIKPGGLNRSASSKNILLRHLDRPRGKNQHQ